MLERMEEIQRVEAIGLSRGADEVRGSMAVKPDALYFADQADH